jgi:hypothetical protein
MAHTLDRAAVEPRERRHVQTRRGPAPALKGERPGPGQGNEGALHHGRELHRARTGRLAEHHEERTTRRQHERNARFAALDPIAGRLDQAGFSVPDFGSLAHDPEVPVEADLVIGAIDQIPAFAIAHRAMHEGRIGARIGARWAKIGGHAHPGERHPGIPPR